MTDKPLDGRAALARWLGRDVRTGEEPDDVLPCDAVCAIVIERRVGGEDGIDGACAVVVATDSAVTDGDVIRACIAILDHYGIEVPTDEDEDDG